jgi:uncharacterized membrane protein
MTEYQWLLFLHVTGAFLLVGGSVVAVVLNVSAMRRERPSEVTLLLGLVRFAVAAIGAGVLLTLVFGLWLVSAAPEDYSYGSFWVIAAVVLWVVSNALGWRGGERDKQTRELAERLATEGDDAPSPALRARLRDPVSLVLPYGSGVAVLLILVDMIWKPGA